MGIIGNTKVSRPQGLKYDQDKPDLSLIPAAAMHAIARALGHGEKKYGRYNYTKGFTASRLVAACLRHLYAWMAGQEQSKDSESGLSHLDHALATLAMLVHCQELGTLQDNRLSQRSGSPELRDEI